MQGLQILPLTQKVHLIERWGRHRGYSKKGEYMSWNKEWQTR